MFMGRSPQQVAQNIQRSSGGGAPYGHPKNHDGLTNNMKMKGQKPPGKKEGPLKGMQNMRYLDHDPHARDGTPRPGYEEELSKAMKDKDVGMISELLACASHNEAPVIHKVTLATLRQRKDECMASLEALLDHKPPHFTARELAELIFESLRQDYSALAEHLAGAGGWDAHDVGVELDRCVVNAKLPAGEHNDDPLLQRLDMFIAEHMPAVEEEINKNLQAEHERIDVEEQETQWVNNPATGGKVKVSGKSARQEAEDKKKSEFYDDDENDMQFQTSLSWRDTQDDDAGEGEGDTTGYARPDEIDPNAPEGDLVVEKSEKDDEEPSVTVKE